MLALLLTAALVAPVPGAVARPFAFGQNPFRAGWHRGADFAAERGAAVRAACTGIVVTARPGLVTLRCGPWRVTQLPVADVSVRAGARIAAGAVVGELGWAAGHAGLHLGVRRAGDRFGYVDPIPLLRGRTSSPPPVPAPRTRVPRGGPGRSRPSRPPAADPSSPTIAVQSAPSGLSAPVAPGSAIAIAPEAVAGAGTHAKVRVFSPAGARALAPWPAWAGVALLLAGAVGGGVRFGARRRRAAAAVALGSAR